MDVRDRYRRGNRDRNAAAQPQGNLLLPGEPQYDEARLFYAPANRQGGLHLLAPVLTGLSVKLDARLARSR